MPKKGKKGMYGKVCPGCGVPLGHPKHKHGCPPKAERPRILSQIEREMSEAAAADAEWQAKWQAEHPEAATD